MYGFMKFIRGIVGLAIICTFVYVFVNWQSDNSEVRGNRDYAESSCLDEIDGRFSTESARVYKTVESDKGYVVRASVTFTNGKVAKIICLTNEFGRVEDVRIETG